MKSILKRAFTLLVLVFFIQNHNAQSEVSVIQLPNGGTITSTKLTETLENAMDSLGVPAISIAITNKEDIVYHKALGVTQTKTSQAVSDKTTFEAASLSKPLFAYFIIKMVEAGDLDLDQPIYPFLQPIFPEGTITKESFEWYQTITPRMILSHSTGIPNWMHGKPITIAFKPGTNFSYSGEAYQHLGAAFGTKMNLGWGGALDSLFLKKVATPLQMKQSFYTWHACMEKEAAYGHRNGETMELDRNKKVGPGYSLRTEAHDFALFLLEMMHPKNISVGLRDEMLRTQNRFKETNELFAETGQTGWGLGFSQKPTPYGLMHLHTGNNGDYQAYTMFIPEQEYGFVLFVNSDNLSQLLTILEQHIGTHF